MFSFGNMKIADPLSPRVIATNDVVDAPKRGPRKFFAAWPHGVDPNAKLIEVELLEEARREGTTWASSRAARS